MRQRARWLIALLVLSTGVLAGCSVESSPADVPTGSTSAPTPAGESATASVSTSSPPGLDTSAYPDGRPLLPIPAVRPTGVVAPPPGRGLARYTGQRLRWRSCEIGRECATVFAPLDYARPDRSAVRLAVERLRTDAGASRGTVVLIPGGPGDSGLDLLRGVSGSELGAFDLVSWDPRGTGASTRVRCDDDLAARFLETDASPVDADELAAAVTAARRFGRSCLQRSGELLAHVSAVEHVADLELLRGLLRLPRLDAYGISYGTSIAALYAATYPDHTGRMVLDSVDNLQDGRPSPEVGAERQIRALATFCANLRCRLGTDPQAVLDRLDQLYVDLGTRPLRVGDRTVTQQLAVETVTQTLYGAEGDWTALIRGLEPALDGQGATLLALYDRNSRRDAEGHYPNLAANAATLCADGPESSVRRAVQLRSEQARRSPVLGAYVGPGLLCTQWPVAPVPRRAMTSTSAELLLLQNTGDNATPIEWAQAVATRFPASRLVVVQGQGHGTFDNACAREQTVAYLATGELPPVGTGCPG